MRGDRWSLQRRPPLRPRRPLIAALVGAALAMSPWAGAGTRIHVRGAARIDVHAARDGGDLVLSGALVDDAGTAVKSERVSVALARQADLAQRVPLDERHTRGCNAGAHDATDPQLPSAAGGPVTVL